MGPKELTVLVNTNCNGILVSCVSVHGINVLIKINKKKNLCAREE